MKIRGSHIAFLIVLLIFGFVVYAVRHGSQPEEPLLQSSQTTQSTATLAPMDGDPDNVARIELETTEMDVGIIANDALHHAKLRVRNRGKRPLKITKITTTCACTQGFISDEESTIAPGADAYIDVVVNPSRIPGFESYKILTIFSNDPENRTVNVGVTARVDPEFELLPKEFDLGEVLKGEAAEATMLLRQIQEDPVEILKIEPVRVGFYEGYEEDFAFSFEKRPETEWMTPGKTEYEIRFVLSPNVPPGLFRQYFYLFTNIRRFPRMGIEVNGEVRSPYELSHPFPRLLALHPSDAAGGSLMGTVTFSAETPIEITDVDPGAATLAATVRQGEDPNTVHIDVMAAPNATGNTIAAVLTCNVRIGEKVFPERVAVGMEAARL